MLTKRPSGFHSPVQNAVKGGALPPVRACNCFVCGKQARHYHHVDYDKPLEVIPVCVKCHSKVHLGYLVREETSIYYFRTTEEMSADIKELADSYGVSMSELARMAVEHFLRTKPIVTMAPDKSPTLKQKGR